MTFKMFLVYLELSKGWQEEDKKVPLRSESCSEGSGRIFGAIGNK
jgi:hypothetical protein